MWPLVWVLLIPQAYPCGKNHSSWEGIGPEFWSHVTATQVTQSPTTHICPPTSHHKSHHIWDHLSFPLTPVSEEGTELQVDSVILLHSPHAQEGHVGELL